MLRRTLPFFFLGLALLVFAGHSFKGVSAQEPKKFSPRLPNGWRQLGLSKEQVDTIYKIQGNYHDKMQALKMQLEKMEKDQVAEMANVLSPMQRDNLRKLLQDKSGLPPEPRTDKTPPKEVKSNN
jgi:hypothetical protein